ncbi:MAG: transcriptional repressor [Candidatus Sericytochromatia bacterium]|nr:MAG: transcriptional repressor [Candidatus Sericytochromatia bacterium]
MNYIDIALKILKDNGYKQTKPRQKVLEILDKSNESLSAYEISDKSGKKLDVVTVYRVLETLEQNNLIHKVVSTGKYRKCYISEKSNLNKCHHNIICKNCGYIEEINCEGMNIIEKVISSNSSFKIENHVLEFYGLCQNCKLD